MELCSLSPASTVALSKHHTTGAQCDCHAAETAAEVLFCDKAIELERYYCYLLKSIFGAGSLVRVWMS